MSKTLGGAEFNPDDGFTAEALLRQVFGERDTREAFARTLRVIKSAPFVGAPSLLRYPVIGPNYN